MNSRQRVLLKVSDNISTDEILPAGARVLPYRSNIPAISQFAFSAIGTRLMRNERPSSMILTGMWLSQAGTMGKARVANMPPLHRVFWG